MTISSTLLDNKLSVAWQVPAHFLVDSEQLTLQALELSSFTSTSKLLMDVRSMQSHHSAVTVILQAVDGRRSTTAPSCICLRS